jgi:LacI family transcriptional regulator
MAVRMSIGDTKTIALVFTYSLSYCRRVLRGIKEFARQREDWVFVPVMAERGAMRAVGRLRADGVIAHVLNRELGDALKRVGKPVVNVSGIFLDLPFPRVAIDNRLVGRLAARHFIDRGISNFAFVGHPTHGYSVEREAGFRDVIPNPEQIRAYHTAAVSKSDPADPAGGGLSPTEASLRRWVASLPHPVGIFACNDIWGLRLTEICRQLRLRVPEDVAIVGVDNDDLLCELARPPLSSVAIPAERVGHEAAKLLERLMAGKGNPARPMLLPPLQVVARQSSDLLAIDDADVSAAIRFIRSNADRPIRVADVLRYVPVSRRVLERKFRQALQRGPFQEIRLCQLERAKSLLASTDMQMPVVAQRAGFTSGKQLSTVFHAELGETPTAYRRRVRARGEQGAAVGK